MIRKISKKHGKTIKTTMPIKNFCKKTLRLLNKKVDKKLKKLTIKDLENIISDSYFNTYTIFSVRCKGIEHMVDFNVNELKCILRDKKIKDLGL